MTPNPISSLCFCTFGLNLLSLKVACGVWLGLLITLMTLLVIRFAFYGLFLLNERREDRLPYSFSVLSISFVVSGLKKFLAV